MFTVIIYWINVKNNIDARGSLIYLGSFILDVVLMESLVSVFS